MLCADCLAPGPTTVRQSPMEPANGSPTETQENLEQALAMGLIPFRLRILMEQISYSVERLYTYYVYDQSDIQRKWMQTSLLVV